MKYLSKLLFMAGVAFGLTACNDTSDIISPDDPQPGDMPVNITFSFADKAMQTRSMVSGDERVVHTMQLVCFDANGLYVGIRNAEVISNGASGTFFDTGVIKGTVPQGTSRIHFIANRNLTIPLSFSNGTAESVVMNSRELSTGYDDKPIGTGTTAHQEICYWGYHKEGSAGDMNNWLNPPLETGNTVYLIRDRAKVVLSYDKTDADVEVTKIEWMIHNGRDRGYLAPAQESWWNDESDKENYYANSTVPGHTSELISIAGMHEYTSSGRYSLWTSEDENEENNFQFNIAYEKGTTTSVPQFLFDDANLEDDKVKVILRVTYNVEGESTPRIVYHVLRLNDNNKVLYHIVRNNTYYIDCKLLSPDVAFYETLKDAINGKEFVNADVEVDWTIPDINNNQYALQIKLPNEGTSIVFNETGANTMDFAFINASDLSHVESAQAGDFDISWYGYENGAIPDFITEGTTPQLELNAQGSVKRWRITIDLKTPTNELQDAWLKVKHTASGLTRYIHVFVIDQFRYNIHPKLEFVSGKIYKLSFQLPPTDYPQKLDDEGVPMFDDNGDPVPDRTKSIYPETLYPIDVKFTTTTLRAYGLTQTGNDYGLFGVSIESTGELLDVNNFEAGDSSNPEEYPAYNDPISSEDADDWREWYYQQPTKHWDFWYTYSIKSYPVDTDNPQNNGKVNIYLEDVRGNIKYADNNGGIKGVGLFMYVAYFGKNYSVPVTD